MKIAPIPAHGMAAVAGAPPPVMNTRSLRMSTNATPGRVDGVPESELTIPDTAEAPAADEETQPLSPQLAALAKQRRALQVKEREIAAREKALEGKSATPVDSISKAKLKSDPIGTLLAEGLTYDDLTNAVMAYQEGTHQFRAMEDKLKAVEEGFDKKLSEKTAQEEQHALAEMRREATRLSAEGDTYELVRETRSIPHVMTLIERTYRETGEVLHVTEALKLVEDELFKDAQRLANLKKVQAQFAPAQPASTTPTQTHRQMRTLTNRDTASVPMSAKARAIAAFNGTLRR